MIAPTMPPGYHFVHEPNAVANAVLGASTWAVLALTCHIELFTQVHYRASIDPASYLSELYKDVFLFHWREESQHAIIDELEWRRENARLSDSERDKAVDDLIGLVGAVDGLLQAQALSDVDYFIKVGKRNYSGDEAGRLHNETLGAYRWQYIVSGVLEPRFTELLSEMTTTTQRERIAHALKPFLEH
jgi:hypothetical protein